MCFVFANGKLANEASAESQIKVFIAPIGRMRRVHRIAIEKMFVVTVIGLDRTERHEYRSTYLAMTTV